MNVGILLRYYRKLKNITQTELAESAEINEKYYSKIERDENNPTYTVLSKIVNALDMKMMQLAIASDDYCAYDYIFYPMDIKDGILIREVPPRFVAEVSFENRVHNVYIACSVKLSSLISIENSKVNLQKISSNSKYQYALFTLDHNSVKIIVDLNSVNKMFYELYCLGVLSGYYWYGIGKAEIVCENYKTDYFFPQENMIIENKTIISESEISQYPIESSNRYKMQFAKIEEMLKKSYFVRMNFFILTPWTTKIIFEKEYENTVLELKEKGLKVFYYYLYYEKDVLKVQEVNLSKNKDIYDIVFA